MRVAKMFLCGLMLVLCACTQTQTTATLFEGARLITGDASAPVENSAFLIEKNTISKVGKKGEVDLPAGGLRVDLSGKTVMPALIDDHTHLGWAIIKTGQIGKD